MARLLLSLLAAISVGVIQTSPSVAGTCTQEWSTDFPGSDFDAVVTSIIEWNGELYAGGDFTQAGGNPVAGLAKWDGSSWAEVGGGITGLFTFYVVQDMVVFDDGNGEALFVCGVFVEADGQPVSSVARWDGANWDDMDGGAAGGASSSVYELKIFDDGNGPALYAGGVFDVMGGVPIYDVAKWDGTSWSPVGSGITASTTGVYAMTVWDGQLVVGGDFPDIDGVPVGGIAAWDGSAWSELGGGAGSHTYAMGSFDLGAGETLFIGGILSNAGGVPVAGIAAWDGTSWSDMNGGLGGDFLGARAFGLFDDGFGPALFVGGGIESAGGVPVDYLAKWDGSSWSDAGANLNSTVDAMYVDGSVLYLGGNFTKSGVQVSTKITAWDGSSAEPLGNTDVGNGLSSDAGAFATVDFDGPGGEPARQFVAGNFFNAGDQFVDLVAELDGSTWIPLSNDGPDRVVSVATAFDDGAGEDLYVGGGFVEVDGLTANYIARWDGSAWSDLSGGLTNSGFSPSVSACSVYDDGNGERLYVGGFRFDAAGGTPVQNIAAWDGTTWSDVGGGIPDGRIADLEIHDSQLVAVGSFETAGGVPAANVARWNGSVWSAVGDGLNGYTTSTASFGPPGEEELFAAGSFTGSGETPLGPIARWDGSSWTDASVGFDGSPLAGFEIFDDGSGPALFLPVVRTHDNGTRYSTYEIWDGSTWNDLAVEFPGYIRGHGVGPDPSNGGSTDALYVGGSFLSVNGISSARVARLGCEDVSSIRSGQTRDAAPAWVRSIGPNPSRGAVVFDLDVEPATAVEIEIFDATGARVVQLGRAGSGAAGWTGSARSARSAGSAGAARGLVWDGMNVSGQRVPAGSYFYRIDAGRESHSGRVTIVR